MIRKLEAKDADAVCSIVNENWKKVYQGYVNPALLGGQTAAKKGLRG
ncbi:MAG: hypothetical protein LKJ90_03955 [Faecalibacterium sp.]|jgi:hypothetical protein|nr:hypothetical protein [Faecalibacterium sp.]